MIRFAEGVRLQRAVRTFGTDPFGVRALAGVLAYGTEQPFAGVWVRDNMRTLLGRTEGALTACGAAMHAEELQAFLDLTGGSTLLVPSDFLKDRMPKWTLRRSGAVFTLQTLVSSYGGAAESGSAKVVTAMLADNPSPWIELGDKAAFYTDLSHRLRHGCVRTAVRCADGRPVACALTVAETDRAAVVGGVVCERAYRDRGHAGAALQALCAALQTEHKAVFLFTGAEMVGFYQKYGFNKTGEWQEYSRAEEADAHA